MNSPQENSTPPNTSTPPKPKVWRVLREHPEISEDRMLSEIGMLFVRGFETTGGGRPRATQWLWGPAAADAGGWIL
jgi:hypothetical protein